MTAETLRKASALIRKEQAIEEDLGHIDAREYATWLAVADWLDAAYEKWRFEELSLAARSVRAMSGGANEPDPHALAVARAYLGEATP